jgi:hypothetical protein
MSRRLVVRPEQQISLSSTLEPGYQIRHPAPPSNICSTVKISATTAKYESDGLKSGTENQPKSGPNSLSWQAIDGFCPGSHPFAGHTKKDGVAIHSFCFLAKKSKKGLMRLDRPANPH